MELMWALVCSLYAASRRQPGRRVWRMTSRLEADGTEAGTDRAQNAVTGQESKPPPDFGMS